MYGGPLVCIVGKYCLVNVTAIHVVQERAGRLISLIHAAVSSAHQQDGALFGFGDRLCSPEESGTKISLQPTPHIQQFPGQFREINGRGDQDIVALLNVFINFLHLILDGAAGMLPAIAAVHAGGYIAPVCV